MGLLFQRCKKQKAMCSFRCLVLCAEVFLLAVTGADNFKINKTDFQYEQEINDRGNQMSFVLQLNKPYLITTVVTSLSDFDIKIFINIALN